MLICVHLSSLYTIFWSSTYTQVYCCGWGGGGEEKIILSYLSQDTG